VVTVKDRKMIDLLTDIARSHDPGYPSSYSMVAVLTKGKRRIFGFNKLKSPALLKNDIYPEICGIHAELHIWHQVKTNSIDIRNGTLYVSGVANNNLNARMTNTSPCKYCSTLLNDMNVKTVVSLREGNIYKEVIS
jgi:hypothetical protein